MLLAMLSSTTNLCVPNVFPYHHKPTSKSSATLRISAINTVTTISNNHIFFPCICWPPVIPIGIHTCINASQSSQTRLLSVSGFLLYNGSS